MGGKAEETHGMMHNASPVLPTSRLLIFSLFTRAVHHSNHNKHNLNCDLSSLKIMKSLQKQLLPECCWKEMKNKKKNEKEKENVIKSMQEKNKLVSG